MSSLLWRTVLRRRGAFAAALVLVLVTAGTALAAGRGDAWRLGYLETLSGYVTGLSGAHTAELLAIVNSSTAAAARAIRAEGLSPTAGTLYVRNAGGGPAANFVANAGTAPFTVNRTTKITNLNADQLDGLDSSGFIKGPGESGANAVAVTPGFGGQFSGPGFSLFYTCPSTLTDNGGLVFINFTGATVNLFTDNGLADPAYTTVPNEDNQGLPTNPAGEFITFQFQGDGQPKIGTIWVFSVHRASDCHMQAQWVTKN